MCFVLKYYDKEPSSKTRENSTWRFYELEKLSVPKLIFLKKRLLRGKRELLYVVTVEVLHVKTMRKRLLCRNGPLFEGSF